MPHSFGLRARTRKLFSKPFRGRGEPSLSTYLQTYNLGDLVDVKGNGSIHKGMPYRYYHGRTGRVWNVTPRAVGVILNKRVGNRIIAKKIHVRIEHVKKSTSQDEFIKRRRSNDQRRRKAIKKNKFVSLKRRPAQPRKGHFVKAEAVETISPLKYELLL